MVFLSLLLLILTLSILAAAGEASSTEKAGSAKSTETITLAATGIEDLFKDSPSLANSQAPQKPQKDVKNDIMSLFEKVLVEACLSWDLHSKI